MNNYAAATLALELLLAAISSAAAQGQSVGQLLDVPGRVEVRRAGQGLPRASFRFPLRTGDELRVRSGHAELVLFQNGARFSLPRGSVVRISPLAVKSRSGLPPRRLPALNLDFIRGIARPVEQPSPRLREILGFVARGESDATLQPRHPWPNGAVRSAPVRLRWVGSLQGDRLQLRVSDGERVVQETDLSPTERAFQLPEGVLRPGRYYAWTVTVVRGVRRGTPCGGLVRILTPEEKVALERLEREAGAARAVAPNDLAPLMLLAQIYERLGLVDDARSTYQTVLQGRPHDEDVRTALKQLPAPD
jgi:hypothetical protein